MDRRDFVKTPAAVLTTAADAQNQELTLGNDQIICSFAVRDRKIVGTDLVNKLSGRHYRLRPTTELRLMFSAATARIEIARWRCTFGPDNDSTPPEQEQGYGQGYHEGSCDDSNWGTCSNPCLYDLSGGHLPLNFRKPVTVYRGYGWFRTPFPLPAKARGEDIFLNVGGYDQLDWNEYWVYVNGVEVGRRKIQSRWRNPWQFRISSNSAGYQALHFGGAENILAIRTHGYDRHVDGWTEDQMDRCWFDPILYDQFLTVGAPYLDVTDFEVTAARKEQAATGPALVVELANRAAGVSAILHYELEGPIRRKWAEVRNQSAERKLLLDVELDSLQTDARLAEGGYGYPVTADDQLFCAIEHPSGLNRGFDQTISLMHFPGKWLNPGQTLKTSSALVGVSPAGQARQSFLDYIESHTARKKKILSLYDSLGITAFTNGWNWTMNDVQNQGILDLLEKFQKRGVHFDYYVPELSLDTTESSDLTRYRLFSFPDGPAAMVERVSEMGMKFGQWFSIIGGMWSNYRNPRTKPSHIPHPAGEEQVTFRHGYVIGGWRCRLCVASEPYFTMLRDAIVHHVRENKVELLKLDNSNYYCNSTEHQHLPGKYSTEEHFNRIIEIARAARQANPDVFIVWYWGAYSPFFALHGGIIFDIRLSMEAASTGDYPALFFRDAVTQGLDQGAQFAKWVPPINHESLGVWLADIAWGNFMGTERWQEALVMDLGRGNLLFPQMWSDLYNLEEHDIEFLARMQALAKRNERVFLTRRYLIGDAWKDDVYGYSYFDGEHGFVFLNNVSFDCRKVRLGLDESIGLRFGQGSAVRLCLHHPGESILMRNGNPDFRTGQTVEIQLRPFEVMMVEVRPATTADSARKPREVVETSPIYSYRAPLRALAGRPDLEVHFAEEPTLSAQGLTKKVSTFESILPQYAGGRYHLAAVSSFKQDGRWWRQSQMSQFVQAIATVDGLAVEFTRTPEYRQTGNQQWNPWIVFSAPLPGRLSGRPIQIGITSYLPEGVEMATGVWIIKEWWRPRMRPLPNYWV